MRAWVSRVQSRAKGTSAVSLAKAPIVPESASTETRAGSSAMAQTAPRPALVPSVVSSAGAYRLECIISVPRRHIDRHMSERLTRVCYTRVAGEPPALRTATQLAKMTLRAAAKGARVQAVPNRAKESGVERDALAPVALSVCLHSMSPIDFPLPAGISPLAHWCCRALRVWSQGASGSNAPPIARPPGATRGAWTTRRQSVSPFWRTQPIPARLKPTVRLPRRRLTRLTIHVPASATTHSAQTLARPSFRLSQLEKEHRRASECTTRLSDLTL